MFEPIETKYYFAACLSRDCYWSGDLWQQEDECENSCPECSGDVEIETEWRY